ncbi:MAG: metallophosphatase family protein [Verrucomicrobiae bacterium]|nr:metallophosphatase family protein [Verrucomicrobiae bacterium]
MKIGVISDTHGYVAPSLPLIFKDVHYILHAGDIGPISVINFLEQIAPVIAVNGNNDWDLTFPYTKISRIENLKLLLTHQLDMQRRSGNVWEKIFIEKPDVIVFGHTHKATILHEDNKLFLNPGYAGKHHQWQRTVAILHTSEEKPQAEIISI